MDDNSVQGGGYCSLKDLNLEIINNEVDFNGGFALCFWLYLPADSSPFPSTILHQQHAYTSSNRPFLALTEDKEMVLYHIRFVPRETPYSNEAIPWMEIPSVKTKNEVPLDTWVHIGCEVSTHIMRLYINGEIMGETRVTCTPKSLKKVSLVGANEDEPVYGYVYGVEILPIMSSIQDYFVKDPPWQLHVDLLSVIDIEEDGGRVWFVVGGKASCRRILSLDVVLRDAFGHLVDKKMEVAAVLTYADNGAHVVKPDALEAPLLTIYDGIEFASWYKPSKLVNGRASFKLKISQLSSKCDNRLFRIKFFIPEMEKRYHFLEAFTCSIWCIARPNTRPSTLIRRHLTSVEPMKNVAHAAKPTPSSNQIKDDKQKGKTLTLEGGQETHEQTDDSSSDSDGSEATSSFKSSPSKGGQVPDLTVFKYCLGNLTEKSLLLKDLVNLASEKDMMDFEMQVYQFSGCLHHRNQIRISKRMMEDDQKVWNWLAQNNNHVLWSNMIPVLQDQFMKISCCPKRILTRQDFEVLRRIGGCSDLVGHESFEKLWCWLYPVAFSLSQNGLNEMWDSRWIEGLITKEEAESSLHGPGNRHVDPGTFVLRFPTSRSWPHPDAGNLIVTYLGRDYAIHHRLLSLDFFHSSGKKSLREMLLQEHELSQLGRVTSRTLRFI